MNPETAATQSRAAAESKLKKLTHIEPAVRALLAERDTLLARVVELESALAERDAEAAKKTESAKKK